VAEALSSLEATIVRGWAGDPAAAAELGREGWTQYLALGEQHGNPQAAGYLAQALYQLGRFDEAEAWARRGASDAAVKEMLWRQVMAKVLARRGEHTESKRLDREAVAICDESDMLDRQGDAYADLGEVLILGDDPVEAAAALRQALDRYERKGNVVSAGRTRARLADLAASAG
jgi:tetratricopeptide (TPR) repeat protein